MIYVRDVRDRVKKLAPFLHIDNDPYPVLAEGRVQYIVDAYTTTSKYPYSQRADTEQLGENSGLRHRFNYVRNSVKAVVDGFDGTTTLYVVDPDDPILQAYRNAFPDLFEDFDNMPQEVLEHIRYPEDLFRVQTNVWARYQLDDSQEFYEQAKGWSVAQDPGAVTGVLTAAITSPDGVVQQPSREARIDPYYLLTRLPEEDDQDFVILRSYVPVSTEDTRRELTAFMVGKGDPDEYGQLVVYKVEPLGLTDGPALVNSKIQSDPSISRVVTLLNQQGSRVEFGDLVLVPVEDSILYVRPLYVVAQSPPVPELQQVIAVLGERVVMCPTLSEALRGLFGLTQVSGLPERLGVELRGQHGGTLGGDCCGRVRRGAPASARACSASARACSRPAPGCGAGRRSRRGRRPAGGGGCALRRGRRSPAGRAPRSLPAAHRRGRGSHPPRQRGAGRLAVIQARLADSASRRTRRKILPETALGMASMNSSSRICLKLATWPAMKSCSSPAVASVPGFSTTKALGISPASSSGTGMTAASPTAGCESSRPSSSAGGTWNPLYLMSSFSRSTM